MLHEGAKRCEGTVALYTVGAKARLGRALGGATVGTRDTNNIRKYQRAYLIDY